jgi:hypothetical protein
MVLQGRPCGRVGYRRPPLRPPLASRLSGGLRVWGGRFWATSWRTSSPRRSDFLGDGGLALAQLTVERLRCAEALGQPARRDAGGRLGVAILAPSREAVGAGGPRSWRSARGLRPPAPPRSAERGLCEASDRRSARRCGASRLGARSTAPPHQLLCKWAEPPGEGSLAPWPEPGVDHLGRAGTGARRSRDLRAGGYTKITSRRGLVWAR